MTTKPAFGIRGLELHGKRMWNWRWTLEALNVMEREELNALVFHQSDMLDHLVIPFEFFTVDALWKRWPVRYHTVDNNRQYISQVIRHCHELGIKFFLEVKEVSFHESILEVCPGVLNADGKLCPTHPFWWRFLRAKMEELCKALPGLDGVIVSPATRESKVSISTNQCNCERCASVDAVAWYRQLISEMAEPLHDAGMQLVLRDFSYDAKEQGTVLEAASQVSERIAVSLKNTPHDFYPTFPHNPKIGHVGAHPQWVEFDVWGQFFGLGVFPSMVLDDLFNRFAHCARQGVAGVVARTDWEVISDAGVLDSLNMVNLLGFAMRARGSGVGAQEVLDHWMAFPLATPFGWGDSEREFVIPASEAARRVFSDIMLGTWPVLRKSVFVLDHVFHEDGMFPDTLKKAYMMLLEVHGIAEWDATKEGALAPSVTKLEEILVEKEDAVARARVLLEMVQSLESSLSADGFAQLRETFGLLVWYTEGFQRCAKACFATQFCLELDGAAEKALTSEAVLATEELGRFAERLDARLADTWYPHQVYWLLDSKRLYDLQRDLSRQLSIAGRGA